MHIDSDTVGKTANCCRNPAKQQPHSNQKYKQISGAQDAKCITASAKEFQADLEVILLVPHCNTIAEQHLYVRWPKG